MIPESVIRKLDRYFAKDENLIGILVVDVQNKADLEEITDRYNVPTRTVVRVSKEPYCKEDEYPRFKKLIAQLENEVKGISFNGVIYTYKSRIGYFLPFFLGLC